MKHLVQSLIASLAISSVALATPFTEVSPTAESALPTGVTKVGGIVLDLVGTNGARLVAQKAASSLYVGYAGSNPQVIGTQTGLTPGMLSLLGGGFSELAVRVTLFDGDTAAGNFDYFNNTFAINGISLGSWSSVIAQNTNSAGTVAGTSSTGGFRDNTLDTGWFHVTNVGTLSSLFTSISSSNQAVYSLTDSDPYDNYYDFTQGVDGGLVNTEVPPVVTPAPDGGSMIALLGAALAGLCVFRRRRA